MKKRHNKHPSEEYLDEWENEAKHSAKLKNMRAKERALKRQYQDNRPP